MWSLCGRRIPANHRHKHRTLPWAHKSLLSIYFQDERESSHMIAVAMGHHHEIEPRQIDAFNLSIVSECFRIVSGIEENALSAKFDQGSITPILLHLAGLTKRVIQNGDLSFLWYSCARRSRVT